MSLQATRWPAVSPSRDVIDRPGLRVRYTPPHDDPWGMGRERSVKFATGEPDRHWRLVLTTRRRTLAVTRYRVEAGKR